MSRMIMVCGPTGVGKTTYSVALSKEVEAIRFSIDPWMNTLFSKDMTSLDYEWMMERIYRCYEQIWSVSEQILAIQGSVVLDLGFTEKSLRDWFVERAAVKNIIPEVHFLDAPAEIRKKRVNKRNVEKDLDVYTFEVTDFMFDFMEPRFEAPNDEELANGLVVDTRGLHD